MELSPQEIRSIGFKLVKKGYDPDQVDSFKDEVASVVEAAYTQATAMEARARAAVAKLHEVSQQAPARDAEPDKISPTDNDVITRTLMLAQRTADATVAEARAESDTIVTQSREEAERLLENARTLASKTIEDTRAEARRAVENDRVHAENELQSLIARRDFLVSDVDHLEQYLQAQRERLREAAVALQELVERVPGGLGEMRRPLLSASAESAAVERNVERNVERPVERVPREATPLGSAAPKRREPEAVEVFDADEADNEPVEEMSELVWDEASKAAAKRAPELPPRPQQAPSRAGDGRPPAGRPPANTRRGGAPSPPFNDPDKQDSVWRMLDEEVASAQAAEAGMDSDDITNEVPVTPRTADTFRVAGDELQ